MPAVLWALFTKKAASGPSTEGLMSGAVKSGTESRSSITTIPVQR